MIIAKKINPKVHPGFGPSLAKCIEAIYGYKRLLVTVEELRLVQYDSTNPVHERKLLAIWNNFMPNTNLEARISKQWQFIGFQGNDPSSDFRGMGVLALDNLLYFTQEYPSTARHLLSHSQHPKYGYTLAVIAINISHMAWRLLMEEIVKSHFYNLSKTIGCPTIEHFHQFFCYLIYEFDRFWMNYKPNNLMEFNIVQQKFEKEIIRDCKKESCQFKINLSVENI